MLNLGAFSSSSIPLMLLLLLLLALGGPGESTEREEPPPCKVAFQCLNYTVVCHGLGYEARLYPASSWVGTRVDSATYTSALLTGFWRLFRYIQGRNEQKAQIPRTSPVLTRVTENQDVGKEEFEVFFMVPEIFQEETPQPTDQEVFLETFPELHAYVHIFGGWMNDENRWAELHKLDKRLRLDGRATRPGIHYTSGFNSPFDLFNRHNEVWRLAEGELGCGPILAE